MIDFVEWHDVESLCVSICSAWIEDNTSPPDHIIGLARGGLVPATIIAHQLGVRTVISHGYHSYDDDGGAPAHARKEHGTMYQDCIEDLMKVLEGPVVLIIDDLCDEGITMSGMVKRLIKKLDKHIIVKTATLYCKEHSSYIPDHVGKMVGSNWLAFPWESSEALQSNSESALISAIA